MNEKLQSIGHAVIDATVNAVAVFTLTMGGLILTSSSIDYLTLEPAFITASAVAMIRFSLRLYQEDGVNLQGLSELPGVPEISDDSKNFWRPKEIVHLCEIVTIDFR